jgi:LPXTG-motif cell wall-anchored protein
MKPRIFTTALFSLLLVAVLAGASVAQEAAVEVDTQEFHVPTEVAAVDVEVLGVTLEQPDEDEVGVEVLGVAQELAVTGSDAITLTLIGLALVGLGFLAVRGGRRASRLTRS